MVTDEEQIAKITTNFQRARKHFYDEGTLAELRGLYGGDPIEHSMRWIASEVSFWYKHMTQIDPNLTQEQKYSIARKFLRFRFSTRYYERMDRKEEARSDPKFKLPLVLGLEELRELNEAPISEVDKAIKPIDDRASIVAEEYLMELIKEEKTQVSGK